MVPRYMFTQGNVLGQIVIKRAHIGDVLNFDDHQKVGQIKNPGIMSCILIRCEFLLPSGTCVQSFGSIALAVAKRALPLLTDDYGHHAIV
jgi:hypothetical protein